MGKRPHKDAGLAMEAATKLADADIASLAQLAADASKTSLGWKTTWATVRIEDVQPGRLSMGVRGPGGTTIHLGFALELARPAAAPYEDRAAVRTRITSYKTRQPVIYGFIPTGPKKLMFLPNYQLFLKTFCAELRRADPTAVIVPDVRTGIELP